MPFLFYIFLGIWSPFYTPPTQFVLTVTDGRNPVSGVSVQLVTTTLQKNHWTTDAQGNATLEVAPKAILNLFLRKKGYKSCETTFNLQNNAILKGQVTMSIATFDGLQKDFFNALETLNKRTTKIQNSQLDQLKILYDDVMDLDLLDAENAKRQIFADAFKDYIHSLSAASMQDDEALLNQVNKLVNTLNAQIKQYLQKNPKPEELCQRIDAFFDMGIQIIQFKQQFAHDDKMQWVAKDALVLCQLLEKENNLYIKHETALKQRKLDAIFRKSIERNFKLLETNLKIDKSKFETIVKQS